MPVFFTGGDQFARLVVKALHPHLRQGRQQTDDGKNYKYVYDAFGRLRQIKHRTTNALISEHTYNALGFRVGWHYDANADADVDGDDPWYWFGRWHRSRRVRGLDVFLGAWPD
ncbi:MAG: hypothetical protein IPM33_09880 [Phycisphaerales bacterium]|nr:hypothetical protein [Phycisphaerales bacterium]